MSSVNPTQNVSSASSSQPVDTPLTMEQISKKLSSMDALHIELIGSKIALRAVNNLGTVAKASVMLKVKEKKGEDASDPVAAMLLRMAVVHANMDIEKGKKEFLSDIDVGRFMLTALWPIKASLADAFSKPSYFLEQGTYFKLSDYEPEGFLLETAKKMGINVSLNDVPSKYYIYLKLDKELTLKKSQLVFEIREESQEVEFSKFNFTIEELTKELDE